MIGLQRLTPGVQNILLGTTGFWIVDLLLTRLQVAELGSWLDLEPAALLAGQAWWTPLTYLLVHQGFWHLFWNMVALWMFGSPVEEALGERRIYQLYLGSGLTAALAVVLSAWLGGSLVVPTPAGPIPTAVAGSSGAVLGTVLAFALLFPEAILYLWFIIPVKARYLAFLVIGLAVLAPLAAGDVSVSIPAHVGGLLGGWAMLHFKLWLEPRTRRAAPSAPQPVRQAIQVVPGPSGRPSARPAVRPIDPDIEREVNQILDKIAQTGLASLTSDERGKLDAHSTRLRQRDGGG